MTDDSTILGTEIAKVIKFCNVLYVKLWHNGIHDVSK